MKKNNLAVKSGSLNHLVLALFLFASPLAGAYAACCAGHGGVASCNKTTGVQMCKDGTASPTCTCAKSKNTKKALTPKTTTTVPATTKTNNKATKTVPETTKSTTKSTTTTTTKPKNSWWGGKSKTTTPETTKGTSTGNAKGCCSNHGGVAQCDQSTGHQRCKDGTQSPSCTCH
ncbi:MAG: hypothetical protein LEGION0403_FIIPPAGN_00217 [Legionella sp.]|uniref:hypothetical protein n=1 Tax=Legionella sp. TaxID=459 RepID=UPI003D1280F8